MRKIYKEFENVAVPPESGKAEYKIYERVVNKDTGEVSLRVSKVANMYNEIQEAGVGSNGADWVKDLELGGKPFITNKYHDYFTSALPKPQKGDAININLAGSAPVHTSKESVIKGKWNLLTFSKADGTKFTNSEEGTGNISTVY